MVATLDTIVVGALVLYVFDDGNVDIWKVLTIAAIEFPLKYIVYYLHERVWENFRVEGETHNKRTLKKSISWRIVATTMTFLIALVVLKESNEAGTAALVLAIIEFFSKFALYYVCLLYTSPSPRDRG